MVTQNKKENKKPNVPGLCQRISLWRYEQCKGQELRQICHLATEDLKEVDKRNRMRDGKPNCFIANKFDIDIDPGAIICMARRIHHREKDEFINNSKLNTKKD